MTWGNAQANRYELGFGIFVGVLAFLGRGSSRRTKIMRLGMGPRPAQPAKISLIYRREPLRFQVWGFPGTVPSFLYRKLEQSRGT